VSADAKTPFPATGTGLARAFAAAADTSQFTILASSIASLFVASFSPLATSTWDARRRTSPSGSAAAWWKVAVRTGRAWSSSGRPQLNLSQYVCGRRGSPHFSHAWIEWSHLVDSCQATHRSGMRQGMDSHLMYLGALRCPRRAFERFFFGTAIHHPPSRSRRVSPSEVRSASPPSMPGIAGCAATSLPMQSDN